MGVEISKHYSYSCEVFATNLLLQTPDGGSHKMFFWNFKILAH